MRDKTKLSPLGIAASILVGLFLAGACQSIAGASGAPSRAFGLRPSLTLRTQKINGSQVNIVKAPLRMLEAMPGCSKFPCGRQDAMLPSVNGARKGGAVAIGGDYVRNGRPVHAYVHNGRTRFRGIRGGDAFFLPEEGSAEIRRARDWMIPEAEELFGGYPQVLQDGTVPSDRGDCKNDDGPDGLFCARQARQGVGLSRDGQTVIIIQVDKGSRSRGMLLPEFGRLFKRYGAYDALNLDGGGSSVMWTRNRTKACELPGGTKTGCLVSRPAYRAENPPTGERKITQSIMLIP